MDHEQKFCIVTASVDHAENGMNWGVVQAYGGKSAPLRRMAAADGVVIYSSRTKFRDGESLMSFTASGRVTDDMPYQNEMAGGFVVWRRRVQLQPAAKKSV